MNFNQIERLRTEAEHFLDDSVKINDSTLLGRIFEARKKTTYNKFQKNKGKYATKSIKKHTISFTCPELAQINDQIAELKEEYTNKQQKYVGQIIDIMGTYHDQLTELNSIISEHDILLGLGHVLFQHRHKPNQPMCLPEFVPRRTEDPLWPEKTLCISDSWHPLISNCVPNSCSFDHEKSRLSILTGPNMGGKSTFIRQVGICCLLAHVGAPVPASSMRLSVLSGIHTRVGASDMQIKGISTFFSEMIETTNMLRSSDENSLLLVDELGRGTSTFEGVSIARATMEYILERKKSFCLFATHFHSLAKDEAEMEGASNLFVSSRQEGGRIVFDYKVMPGRTSRSFGINIIKNLEFPKSIIAEAESIERKFVYQKLL